ncbi:putative pleckstrin homology domain-containing family O [Blattamonas nauphoetae]|uniref:Pleckstrin homology domain-containing family O n=1 Tax=Blattamonas nauphoetae TaxID=2049346 RepID=A0ABQ9Y6A7_9EUKA|nr:putative pleckstrin homology domain-containing family O [Blattamonas nauphoetae]
MSKQGWITKEGGQLFKNWKKRYAVLDQSQGTLTYFETDKPNQKALGVVSIRGSTIKSYDTKTKGKDNLFMISSAGRDFYAFAETKEEQESWVKSLQDASKTDTQSISDQPQTEGNDGSPTSLYAGWLTKEAGSAKNWRKRWFVLTPSDLSYFKNKKADDPQGSIPLASSRCFTVQPPSGDHPYLFFIETSDGNRIFRVEARNEREMKGWIEEVNKAIVKATSTQSSAPAGSTPAKQPVSATASSDDDEDDNDDDEGCDESSTGNEEPDSSSTEDD